MPTDHGAAWVFPSNGRSKGGAAGNPEKYLRLPGHMTDRPDLRLSFYLTLYGLYGRELISATSCHAPAHIVSRSALSCLHGDVV